jgi:hypothetical protein
MEIFNRNSISGYQIHTRFFIQRGFGSNFPLESMLYAAGSNPESLMENPFTRSKGWIPNDWTGYSNNSGTFHMGGGLNLRGFSGYYMTEPTDDGSVNIYQGTSGIAFNTEIDYTSKIPKLNYWGLSSYIFMDVGVMNENNTTEKIAFSRPHMDLGMGFSWELSRLWDHVLDSEPLVLRVDLPLYVNHSPSTENSIKLRCIFGLNRAF